MPKLLNLAKKSEDLVKPFGEIDVLLFYGIVGEKLKKFLKGKELATKIWMPYGIPYLIKRGSKLEPLLIEEFLEALTPEFFEKRKKNLDQVKGQLTKSQTKVWQYFFPRKLMDFFYATNSENPGRAIDRIFFDIDRGDGMTSEQSQEATREFVKAINQDKELKDVIGKVEPFISWTGNSFHVYLFLDKQQPSSFYEKHFQYLKAKPDEGFTAKWCNEINKKLSFKIIPGHEKVKGTINIDPSQTPSGKLCRVPLGSLHMKDDKTVDGVSFPVAEKMLEKDDLIDGLRSYTAKDVVDSLDELAKRFPKKFQ
ncbi:MAG: hypothetical protein COY38_04205 [Candidatus Aenigmarchaeota archaeon CG_4_10_14_0_8_um_filter_37_24]|nr:hypothetical protein [Candidatus Aenigmarchaeota archaeon]OIN85290.1 MAG: hypothetical protein AUJ50_05475 [Candidatus Aenigmarchaeota archaeon CG1_02_38_14]PIV68835.1 MAG: hypothetical protein COS07_02915 [Candidatus Aenigmarchaeota archaeon CG01_land_8_20_14_3_00_37_9]PIW40864.1 MAG: hypothetical protein COW21_04985 [Candidatus Aenigmarchaeota archaeon CG15_BIG_FIL_POST_REV_8_21_14_020_37_27]PIX51128.1 MAG: hypothetical protein COZ52_00530 [Candidatus Aenigmarchaeota archaeon CG_4_8_14_3_u